MNRISRRNFLKAAGVGAAALGLAACGGSGSSTAASTNTDGSTATTDTAAADESNLGYEYGEHFHSDEPVTYTMALKTPSLIHLSFMG